MTRAPAPNPQPRDNALEKVKSGISIVNWCDTPGALAKFVPATIAFDSPTEQNISWFDKLFEGGLALPRGDDDILRPITMLVSGPPGCGKTTLITELCYRLAVNEQKNSKPLSTLYISTDAETIRVKNNAIDLGWSEADRYFIPFDPNKKEPAFQSGLVSLIGIWGREKFQKSINQKDMLYSMIEAAVTSLDRWLLKANAPELFLKRLKYRCVSEPVWKASDIYLPDILVVDSLNILNPESQVKFFQSFVRACRATKLVVFMLNTGTENPEHKLWEYYSDIVLQLDHEYIHDYYVRTIEVVKARYQAHMWGKHQLKIYSKPTELVQPPSDNINGVYKYNTLMKRRHPYRNTGGIFIFPSIHSYLSIYKRKTPVVMPTEPKKKDRVDTYPLKLNSVIQLPKGRCTAFIGERGGHKSHLGYVNLLHRVLRNDLESCLIISLREDEGTTRRTLHTIAQQEFGDSPDKVNAVENGNRLEILYFPPGYITPEEFFHRVFISAHRLKSQSRQLTVLFNSLDQISARFPLCAKEEIFIPGIIQTLSGEGVTSICIAVDEPGQPKEQYGLLPMADLIVSFSMRRFPTIEYYRHIGIGWQEDFKNHKKKKELIKKYNSLKRKAEQCKDLYREAVVLQVIRFSGGERAGKRGILELVNDDELDCFPYPDAGLHFTPLSEEADQGTDMAV